MQAIGADRTAIVIAHRLNAVRQADRIVVMEAGRHGDLVATGGVYTKLIVEQDL